MTSAIARGLATIYSDGTVLDAWFPAPELSEDSLTAGTDRVDATELGSDLSSLAVSDEVRGTQRVAIETRIADLDAAPVDTYDAYLRLHLLSHRLVRPNTINLDGIFGVLNNVVWTNQGPCHVESFNAIRAKLAARGPLTVMLIDKFPRMVDYVVPTGVRIGNADRIRLGAYLSPGTTVMHEGFVNFNAGTLGESMIEGRVSQGVVVGNGSDLGGSASVMGTLSGGGKQVVSIGERCLIGANAGIGISLGNDCVVEAGLYITAGTKVLMDGKEIKALELSGADNVLFRRNSLSGAVEAVPWKSARVQLNADLHAN